MIRELAGYDPRRYEEILDWPVAEALAAFEARLKEEARHSYTLACQMWAALAATGATKKRKPPELPAILKE